MLVVVGFRGSTLNDFVRHTSALHPCRLILRCEIKWYGDLVVLVSVLDPHFGILSSVVLGITLSSTPRLRLFRVFHPQPLIVDMYMGESSVRSAWMPYLHGGDTTRILSTFGEESNEEDEETNNHFDTLCQECAAVEEKHRRCPPDVPLPGHFRWKNQRTC